MDLNILMAQSDILLALSWWHKLFKSLNRKSGLHSKKYSLKISPDKIHIIIINIGSQHSKSVLVSLLNKKKHV